MKLVALALIIIVALSAAHALGKLEGRREGYSDAKRTIETFVDGYVAAKCRAT